MDTNGQPPNGSQPTLSLNLAALKAIPGMKVERHPNATDDTAPVPHIFTFTANLGLVGRVYRNPDEAWRDSHKNARAMRNDLAVMECIEARQRAVALLPWHLETDNPRRSTDKELVESMTAILKRTPRFTEYRRSLLEAIWYGRQGVQHNFGEVMVNGRQCVGIQGSADFMPWYPINGDKIAFSYDGQKIGIRIGYAIMDDEWLSSPVTGKRRRLGFDFEGAQKTKRDNIHYATEYSRVYWLEREEIERMAFHKHMIEDADFEDPISAGAVHGIGIRSRIYWTWFQKQNTLANLLEYLERSALGVEIWSYPSGNKEAYENVKVAATQRGNNNIIFVPRVSGEEQLYDMERMEPGLAGVNAVNDIVHQFFNWQIKRYILGQILSTEPEGGGLGSSGLSDFQAMSYKDVLKYDADNLQETLTEHTVKQLVRRNRNVLPIGSDKIHLRFAIDTESDQAKEHLEAIEKAHGMGLPIKQDSLYELLGIEKPQPEDEILPPAGGGGGMPGGFGGMMGAGINQGMEAGNG